MKLSREWLHEFADLKDISDKEYADRLTLSGSIVEATDNLRSRVRNVVIGRVTGITRHENSDHLWVCEVDAGGDAPVTIVTGAQNLTVGDVVPAALHNSMLPGGVKITKGKIRGVKSEGMLCGLEELGLDTHDFPFAVMDGILALNREFEGSQYAIGSDASGILGFDDSVAEFEITNNRPDCLSVRGLARESAVTFDVPLSLPSPQTVPGDGNISDWLKVDIEDADLCVRYSARVVKNIKVEPSPAWMRRRLRASGVRPINNIVDITNYVMLEYGQPMHGFDYSCLSGGMIKVRRARLGETITTLDGALRNLSTEMLLIADSESPVGVAGVMGGEYSGITDSTKAIVLESAVFNGLSIRKTAQALGMRTDASARFEKGLDVLNTVPALNRACELITRLGAGEVVGGMCDCVSSDYTPNKIALEAERINLRLGTEIPAEFMRKTLTGLGFTVEGETVTVPSWRSDVADWYDLSEEAARFFGYDRLGEAALPDIPETRGLTPVQKFRDKLKRAMQSLGYCETLTFSLSDDKSGVRIINPLGEDKAYMRTALLPGLLDAVRRNAKNSVVGIYDCARVYANPEHNPEHGCSDGKYIEYIEREQLAAVLFGTGADFYAFKGDLEELFDNLRLDAQFRPPDSINPGTDSETDWETYHPGRRAEIYVRGPNGSYAPAGSMGQVHPAILDNVYAVVLDVQTMFINLKPDPIYSPVPKYPPALRDLAFVCRKDVTVRQLTDCIGQSGGKLLVSVRLFDMYEGEQVPDGHKSLAFSLEFRSSERSLTDAEVNAAVDKIISGLKAALGAELR